jgi:hypothetical protein
MPVLAVEMGSKKRIMNFDETFSRKAAIWTNEKLNEFSILILNIRNKTGRDRRNGGSS